MSEAPGLVWAFDFAGGAAGPAGAPSLAVPPGTLRWLHVNLADQASVRWLAGLSALPEAVRELLLSPDLHPRALVDEGVVACVFHDVEVDFGAQPTMRLGVLRSAVGPDFIITARHHPLYGADIVKRRLDRGVVPEEPADALDLLVSCVAEVAGGSARELSAQVAASEDAILEDGWNPDQRALVLVRRRTVLMHRQLAGLHAVLARLEEEEALPEPLLPAVVKLSQRVASLDTDVLSIQADLRRLREEIDLQQSQRVNRNLYVLSILSALLLPATLVTGFFGMNTGGLPLAGTAEGTLFAALLAGAASFGVYLWLRRRGFLDGR